MVTVKEPWQSGPTELIEHAIEHIHHRTDFDRRVGFMLLDVGVEILFKTFLALPEQVTGTKMGYTKREEATQGSFHDLVEGLNAAARERLKGINLSRVEYYHRLRNKLYHDGSGITVPIEDGQEYAQIAVLLLKRLLGIDLTATLTRPQTQEQERIAYQARIDAEHRELEQQTEAVRTARKELAALARVAIEKVNPKLALPSFERRYEETLEQSLKAPDARGIRELDGAMFEKNLAKEVAPLLSNPELLDQIEVEMSVTAFFISLMECIVDHDEGENWTFVYNYSNLYPVYEQNDYKPVYDADFNQIGIEDRTHNEIIDAGKEWVRMLDNIRRSIERWYAQA